MKTTVRVSLWVDNNPVWSAEEDISDRAARRIQEKRFKPIVLAAVREIMSQVLADEMEEHRLQNKEDPAHEPYLPQVEPPGREAVEENKKAQEPGRSQSSSRPRKFRQGTP